MQRSARLAAEYTVLWAYRDADAHRVSHRVLTKPYSDSPAASRARRRSEKVCMRMTF